MKRQAQKHSTAWPNFENTVLKRKEVRYKGHILYDLVYANVRRDRFIETADEWLPGRPKENKEKDGEELLKLPFLR